MIIDTKSAQPTLFIFKKETKKKKKKTRGGSWHGLSRFSKLSHELDWHKKPVVVVVFSYREKQF